MKVFLMKQIWHNHNLWEEVKYGAYNKFNPKEKEVLIQKVIYFFNNEELVKQYMERVVEEFKYSCEHNFTNKSLNKIAFLGQSAVCVYANIPFEITMEAWNYLDIKTQERANNIAKNNIDRWIKCQKNI